MPKPSYPPTRIDTAVEELHGERVPDPYRWLEDGDSDETRAWTEAQNRFTREYLDAVPASEDPYPTYTVPSAPIAGHEATAPLGNSQSFCPAARA